MSFDSLGLSEVLLRAIREKGYTSPSPIQLKAIPAIQTGRDVLAAAQTGTGKTAAFTLPILHKLSDITPVKGWRPVRALIMTPTRELAAQVLESVKTYGSHVKLRSMVVFGGIKINPQIAALQRGVDILVATPGRLLDLHGQKAVNLSKVEVLVLDEADRMLDMGFINDIRKIIKLVSQQRQTLLFSATFSKEIRDLTAQLLKDPIYVEVAARNTAAELVEHMVYRIDKGNKPFLLKQLILDGNWEQVLVFARTKHGANRLCEKLESFGISASAIHGNKSQNVRTRTLAEFKAGRIRVLVATDIAARGLDIKQLPHVVNFELPNVPEDYVHRIGRTGRAGSSGLAVSLVCAEEVEFVRRIEQLLGQRLPIGVAPGFQNQEASKAKPDSFQTKRTLNYSRDTKPAFGRGSKPASGRVAKPASGRVSKPNVRSKAVTSTGPEHRNHKPSRFKGKARMDNPVKTAAKKGGNNI